MKERSGNFGGLAEEVLLDNARALVTRHDAATREVTFNERFRAFAAYWGFRPRACAPYRARTKGKDERGVGYVKRNAVAGHRFATWAELEAHLARWTREVADVRVHGTTGEAPLVRFERDEAKTLRPLNGRPPFRQIRELTRVVHRMAAYAGRAEVARHDQRHGRPEAGTPVRHHCSARPGPGRRARHAAAIIAAGIAAAIGRL